MAHYVVTPLIYNPCPSNERVSAPHLLGRGWEVPARCCTRPVLVGPGHPFVPQPHRYFQLAGLSWQSLEMYLWGDILGGPSSRLETISPLQLKLAEPDFSDLQNVFQGVAYELLFTG